MTYLTPHLPFAASSSSSLPPASSHLIISDTLASPSHFATYHLVSSALGKEKRRVVWVDFRGEGRASWEAVLKKLGTPLPPTASKEFVHIAPSSLPHAVPTTQTSPKLFDEESRPSLRPTCDAIIPNLKEGSLVILDGLSELVWMGIPSVEVGKFVRAVFAKVRNTQSILVSTIHADHLPLTSSSTSAPSANDANADLLERLLRIGQGGWWRISHLPSGRSGDVMGEISSHPLGTYVGQEGKSGFPSVPRSNPLQYRLESSTVRVFPKGTGRGFL
ncbi:hypothetical protein CI109_100761 [Kwoniella shandongensis]|uniref:Uncharacterized protein n=1 Tax=Kwoniella shandongensis TaxID=1734106 RepID=A0A5M6C0C7_9TREE|nr:uncharacterized protein CI109_005060 [Kwoniella shandongensis]KAA5526669.1 hypothetical protein CI109_005060 [Kwoniella shandongensis]